MLMVYLEMSSLFFFLSGVVRWRGRPVRAGVGSGAGLSGGVVRRCPVLGAGFRGVLRCALVWLRRTWGKLGGVYLGGLAFSVNVGGIGVWCGCGSGWAWAGVRSGRWSRSSGLVAPIEQVGCAGGPVAGRSVRSVRWRGSGAAAMFIFWLP